MDANRFDDLVKRVGVTRLTRWGALRGLAAGGLAALTGVSLSADETDAAKNDKKKRICHCAGSTVDTCRNKKLSKAKAKKHLKKHKCDYKGKCRGFNPCSPAPTSGSCSSNAQCGNQACVGG